MQIFYSFYVKEHQQKLRLLCKPQKLVIAQRLGHLQNCFKRSLADFKLFRNCYMTLIEDRRVNVWQRCTLSNPHPH